MASGSNIELCIKCGIYPQSSRSGVIKGQCCNKCPNHGAWCTSKEGDNKRAQQGSVAKLVSHAPAVGSKSKTRVSKDKLAFPSLQSIADSVENDLASPTSRPAVVDELGTVALVRSTSDGRMQEDAPADHAAHRLVKFEPHSQGALYKFHYNGEHFQVTVGQAHNSEEQAARIARLCYLEFEKGRSKEDVRKYKEGEIRKLTGRRCAAAAALKSSEDDPKRTKKSRGAVGSNWVNQLGSKHSCLRELVDPLDHI